MSGTEMKFAELKKIAANQQELNKKYTNILDSEAMKLAQQETALNMKQRQIMEALHLDIRRQVDQTVDFAINSLPWWRRSVKNIMDRAAKLNDLINEETAILVKMKELEYARQETELALQRKLKEEEMEHARAIHEQELYRKENGMENNSAQTESIVKDLESRK